MNNDTSRVAVNEEVLLDNGKNDDDYAVSQDANRNNKLMHSETSKREENKEALVNMEFHDTSSSAVDEEVLIIDRRNGDDDCAVSKDTDKIIKLVPYDTSRRNVNEEAMDDKVFHDTPRNVVNNEALVGDKGDDYVVFQDAARSIKLVPYDIPRKEENEVSIKDSDLDHFESLVNQIHKCKRLTRPPLN